MSPTCGFFFKTLFVAHCLVLTAGHCMQINQPLKSVNVYLGRHFRSSGGIKYRVDKATFHPGFDGMMSFDLLLLRLDRAVTFSATISPVCLPSGPEDSPSPGTEVLASGWGHDVPYDVDLVRVPCPMNCSSSGKK